MANRLTFRLSKLLLLFSIFFVLTVFISTTVYSKPPPWAPAHGYRHKHKNKHAKHNGHYHYEESYADLLGIFDGKCKYEKIGTVVGAATGAVIGAKVTDKNDRVVGVLAGTVVGILVGKTIGKAIDEQDRHCASQALEFVGDGQNVLWRNPNTYTTYQITPVKTYQQNGLDCRQFVTKAASSNGHVSKFENDACLHEDGAWRTLY